MKEQKGGFLSMCASLMGNLLTGKGEGGIATSQGRVTIRACSDF